MPQISRQKCGIVTTLVSRFIGIAYEGISSFLQRKCKDTLQKAVLAMNNEAAIQHNKLLKLDNNILMNGIYNADTLEKLIKRTTTVATTKPPLKEEPKTEGQATSQKEEKCGWGPDCPFCKSQKKEGENQ